MVNIAKIIKTNFLEEININPKCLIESYIEDYGKDGEKLFTKQEEVVRDKYYKGRYILKDSMRLFCRDCLYYKICEGQKWENGCKYRKVFLETIEKYIKGEIMNLKDMSIMWGLNKVFRSILEDYILDKQLYYSKNGRRYLEKDIFDSLVNKLLKEIDNVIRYGSTSYPFSKRKEKILK